RLGVANTLNNLGEVACREGDYLAARSMCEESLSIRQELGDEWGIASSLNNLGSVAYMQGNYSTSRSMYRESLTIRRKIWDKRGITKNLTGLGGVAVGIGQEHTQRGARLLGAVEALLGAIGAVLDTQERMVYEQGIASARAQLSAE